MKAILVVDDELTILELLTTLLDEEGYRVIPAVDGEAALAVLEREPVDLVITDVMMPRLGGVELVRALRQRDGMHATPVVLISAALTPPLDGLDPCWYVAKPFDVDDLLAVIADAVGRRHFGA